MMEKNKIRGYFEIFLAHDPTTLNCQGNDFGTIISFWEFIIQKLNKKRCKSYYY